MKYKVELRLKVPVMTDVEAENDDLAYQLAKINVGKEIQEHGLTIAGSDLSIVKLKRVRLVLKEDKDE